MLSYLFISVCKTLDDKLNILLDVELPVYEGTEIPYRCARNRVRKIGNIAAICLNGKIVVSDPCIKIGRDCKIIQ